MFLSNSDNLDAYWYLIALGRLRSYAMDLDSWSCLPHVRVAVPQELDASVRESAAAASQTNLQKD
jgi:hypothetical protein